jgi:hypothetical protein
MDYAPGKLDNAVLLDYGVLDRAAPKVGCTRIFHISRNMRALSPLARRDHDTASLQTTGDVFEPLSHLPPCLCSAAARLRTDPHHARQ